MRRVSHIGPHPIGSRSARPCSATSPPSTRGRAFAVSAGSGPGWWCSPQWPPARRQPGGDAAIVVWQVADTAKAIYALDDYDTASMVSNLMLVLCGEQPATPVVNAGSLYT